MQWSDDAIVLGGRDHGETSVILELMTRHQGRHLGIVHGGRSRRVRPMLQAGNGVVATWRARTDEQLGHLSLEPAIARASRLMASPLALYGLGTLALHLRLLPERDPHPGLYEAACVLLDHLDEAALAPALFVRFEMMLLAELGYGLDLSTCAATGRSDDLAYVSPRSGRAVGREAGGPYDARLLRLPAFLTRDEPTAAGADEVAAGFLLTGFFLDAHVYGPQGRPVPEERARFVAEAGRPFTDGRSASAMVPASTKSDSPRDLTP